MRPSSRRLVLALACAAAGLVVIQAAPAGIALQAAPVPSLDPQTTQAHGSGSSTGRRSGRTPSRADCRPLRGVFYAATDWLRLATTLAAQRISVRAVLRLRPARRRGQDQAATRSGLTHPRARAERPRARGDPLHRVAEVGHEHRRRRGTRPASRRAAGWPPPGTTSQPGTPGRSTRSPRPCAAVTGTAARTSASFLRGLFDAAGEGPPTRGVVSIVGIGQRVARGRDLQGPHAGVATGLGVLGGHERLRQRLVAGGLRRRAQLRGAGRAARQPA